MIRIYLFPVVGSTLLTIMFVFASCVAVPPPQSVEIDSAPPLPFENPNIIGQLIERPLPPIPTLTMQSALACLATGRPVYGIAKANTNVRIEPEVEACRIGRAPQGTLIRVEGIFQQGELQRLTSLRRSVAAAKTAALSEESNDEFQTVSRTDLQSAETESTDVVAELVAAFRNSGTVRVESDTGIGYDEDILPIFERSCNACHNEIARSGGLVVTDYDLLLQGGDKGIVVKPGSIDGSMLWWQIYTDRMPVIGELSQEDKDLIKAWIELGTPKKRSDGNQVTIVRDKIDPDPEANIISGLLTDQTEELSLGGEEGTTTLVQADITNLWLELNTDDFDDVPNSCQFDESVPHSLASGSLIQLISCGVEPGESMLTRIRSGLVPVTVSTRSSQRSGAASFVANTRTGISAAPLNFGPPQDSDEFMIPKGNFCLEPRYMKLHEQKSITAMTFAPDGRLFMAIDDMPTGQNVDQLILLDAFHPSRSVAVIDSNTGGGFAEIVREKGRITGLDYFNGALYVSLAGEVGVVPDGQEYKKLAGGFAVASQYFHANNAIVVSDGWVYVATGGIRDGWSDGPIQGMAEDGAMHVVTGGNPWASRIVRVPLDVLLRDRNIGDFQTAARGWRNPYGMTRGPDGRLWITDNGATNVPDEISAGDEVNVFDPRTVAPGTPDGNTPYFGFPLSLTNGNPGWYVEPALALPNASAPTGISWAYGTVFYGQYGTQPGLYRLANSGGRVIAERVMMGWPIVSLATAPDGSLWIGMGTGGIYRLAAC